MSNAFRDYFTRRSPASGRVLLGVWLASYLSASTPGLALPQDGQVTHGSGSIDQTSARTMEIRQASERMAASFSSFDIAAQEAVNVAQPGSSSVFLGNISGESATTIFGTLTANGSVMLVNPRGVVFGKGSRVDTASLIASSLGVDVDDFMAGALELEFSADMAGRIVNRGVIQAAKGGSVTLMGDEVINEGLIVAEMGRVDLASGSEAVLTFDQDRLIGLKVTKSALGDLGGDTAVLNSGTIEADGGQIFLSADAARDLFSRAVQNEGILRANRAEEVDGEIVLSSSGDTWNSGRIQATADSGKGGSVQVLGDRVAVTGEIDASGADGGGEVLVGGDYQGKGETQTATKTWVGPDAELRADATEEGDGGRVIVWADDSTRFFGTLSARGGPEGGDGGFAEVSGKEVLEYRGTADLTATDGDRGILLLDPASISIEGGSGDGAADGTDSFEGDASATSGAVAFADASPTTVFESELEAQSSTADIVLQATDFITATGTFAGDDLTLATDSNLTLETRNAAGDAIGGINLTGSTAGNDLLVRTQGTGSISITAGTDGAQASNLVLPKLQSDTGTIDLNASNSAFLRGGISTNGAGVSVSAAADISLDAGTGADIDTAGGLGGAITLTPGTGVVRTPGDGAFLVTDGGTVDIVGSLFINGGMTIDTDGASGFAAESGNAAGNVTIDGFVSGDDGSNDILAIDATGTTGSGAVAVTGGIGTVTVAGGNDVYSVQIEGDTVAVGGIETSNTVDGQFIDLTGSSGITLTGSSYSVAGIAGGTADTISLNGPITLESDVTLTGAGQVADAVTLAGTIDGDAAANDRTLTVSAGTADLGLGDGIGQTEALGGLFINDAGAVIVPDVTTRGTAKANGNSATIDFGVASALTGDLTLEGDLRTDGAGAGTVTGGIRFNSSGDIVLDDPGSNEGTHLVLTADGDAGTADGAVSFFGNPNFRDASPGDALEGLELNIGANDLDLSTATFTNLDHLRVVTTAGGGHTVTTGNISLGDGNAATGGGTGSGLTQGVGLEIVSDNITLGDGTGGVSLDTLAEATGGAAGDIRLEGAIFLDSNAAGDRLSLNTDQTTADGDVVLAGDLTAAIAGSGLSVTAGNGTATLETVGPGGMFGDVAISAATIELGGDVTTSTTQNYTGNTVLTNSVTLTGTGLSLDAVDDDNDGGTPSVLTLNDDGTTDLAGIVGGSFAIDSLTTDAAGSTTLGGNVTTVNNLTFNDSVTLAADVRLRTTDPGTAVQMEAVDSDGTPRDLTFETNGVTVSGLMGNGSRLGLVTASDMVSARFLADDGAGGGLNRISGLEATGLDFFQSFDDIDSTGAPVNISVAGSGLIQPLVLNGLDAGGQDVLLSADSDIVLDRALVSIGGNLTIRGTALGTVLNLGSDLADGALDMSDASLDRIDDGFASVTFGQADQTGNLNIDRTAGDFAIGTDLSFIADGAGAQVSLNGAIDTTASVGNGISISSGDPFRTPGSGSALRTDGGTVQVDGGVDLNASLSVDTDAGNGTAGAVTLNGAIGGDGGTNDQLFIDATGATTDGDITLSGDVGGSNVLTFDARGAVVDLQSVTVDSTDGAASLFVQGSTRIDLNGTTYSVAAGDGDADTIEFDGPVRLGTGVAVIGGGGAGDDITFGGTVDATGAFTETLDVTAGAGGDVLFSGAVGGTNALGTLTLNQAARVDVDGAVRAANLIADGGNIDVFDSTGFTIDVSGDTGTAGGEARITASSALSTGVIEALGGTAIAGGAGNDGGLIALDAGAGTLAFGSLLVSGSDADAGSGVAGGQGGIVRLSRSGGPIDLDSDIFAFGGFDGAGSVEAPRGLLAINAGGAINQAAGLAVGELSLTAAGNVTLQSGSNQADTIAASITGGNSLAYTDIDGFEIGSVDGGALVGITATGGSVTLESASGADTVSQSAAIDTGTLTLAGAAGTVFDLGDVTNTVTTLDADDATLGGLTFGEADGYDVAGIDVTDGTATLITDAAAVTQSGAIVAATLDLRGAGAAYDFSGAGNDVASLDAGTDPLSSLNYTDSDDFDVASLTGSSLTLASSGAGNVTQSGAISGGTLTLDGAGTSFVLTGGTNNIVRLDLDNATFATVDFAEINGLEITGGTTTGDLSITAPNIDLVGAGSTLQTTAGGNLTLDGTVDLIGSGTRTLRTNGTPDGNILVTGVIAGDGDDDLSVDSGVDGTTTLQGFSTIGTYTQLDGASLTVNGASDATTVSLDSTSGGAYAFDGFLDVDDLNTNLGDFSLTLNGGGNIANLFEPDMTGSMTLNGVTLAGGADFRGVDTVFDGATVSFEADSFFGGVTITEDTTVEGGANALSFEGAMDDDGVAGTGSALVFNTDSTITFTTNGTVGAGNAVDSFTTNGTGTVNFGAGTLNVAGNTTTFNTALVLGADMTVTDAGGGTDPNPLISFNDTVTSPGNFSLRVDAINGGTIEFNSTVGNGGDELGNLTISQSDGVTFAGTVDLLGEFAVSESLGTIHFQDVLTANAIDAAAGTTDYSVLFSNPDPLVATAPAIAGTGSFANTGGVEFDEGGSFGGGITVSGGTTTLAGTLSTTNSAIGLQTATILDGNAALSSGTGTIDLSTIDDDGVGATASNLTITSDGRVTFAGVIGTTAIDSLTINEATLGAGAAFAEFDGVATVNASGGTLTFNTPVTVNTNTTFTDTGATGITFDSTVDGPAGIEIDASGSVAFNDVVGGTNALNFLTLTASSDTTFASTVDVTNLVQLTNTDTTINFQDVLTAGSINADANGFVVDFDAAPAIAGAGTFDNTDATVGTQDLIFGSGGAFDGGLSVAAGTETQLAGTLTTEGGNANLTLGDTLTLSGNGALVSGNGTISTRVVTGAFDLALQNLTSAGPVQINGPLTVDSLTTVGAGYSVSVLDGGTITQDVNFLNTGTVTLGDDAADVLTFDGGLATTGNATNPGSTSISGTVQTSADRIDLGTISLGAASVVDSAEADLNLAGVSNGGGFALDLDGGSAGAISVGGTVANLGNLGIVDSAGTTFGGNVSAADVTITNSTGIIDFQNTLTASGSVSALADAYAVEFDARPDVTGSGSFANTGGVTFTNGGLFDAGLTVNGGVTSVAGTLATLDSPISLNAVTLNGSTTLDSAGGALTTGAVTGGGNALVLHGGATGTVEVASFDGGGNLGVVDSDSTTFTGAVTAGTVTLTDTGTSIAFQGDTEIQTQLSTASQPYELSFTGSVNRVEGDTTLASTGAVVLGDDATDSITFVGGLDTRTASGTSTAGTVETTGARMDLSALTLTADTTLLAGDGAIQGTSATDGGNSYTLSLQDAGETGAVTFTDALTLNAVQTFAGAYDVNLLGGGTIDTDTTFANTTRVALGDAGGDSITFTGGLDTTAAASTRVAGNVATDGTQMDLGDTTLDANATLVSGAGAINVASVTDGPNNFALSLQDGAATGAVTIDGDLSLTELLTFAGGYDINLLGGGTLAAATDFLNSGALVIGDAAGDIFNFNGGLDTTNGPTSLSLAGTIRTSNQAMDLADATLTDATTLSSGAGTITTGAISDGGANLALTLQDGTAASTGTVAITGNLAVEDLVTFGQGYSVELGGATSTVDQAVDFLNTGTVRLGDGGDQLTFNGGLATAGNATNPSSTIVDGDVVVGAGTALTLGSTTLGGNSSLDAAGAGDLATGAISGAGFDLALDGGTGAVLVDSFSNLGALTLVDAASASFSNASSATGVDLNGTQNGTYTFSGPLTATTLSTNAANDGNGAFTLDLLGGLTITDAVTFDHTGDLVIGAAGITLTFDGGFTSSGVGGSVTLAGNIVSSAGLNLGDLTLTADTTLDSNGAALTAGTITSNNVFALTLSGASAGAINVGSLVDGGDLTIADSGSTTFSGAVNANTLTLTDTSGTIAFQGDTTIDTALVSQVNPYSVAFTGANNSIAGTTTFNHSGSLTLGDGGDSFSFDGGITATAPGTIDLNGTVSVNSGVITLGDADTTVNVLADTTLGGAATAINVGLAKLSDDTTLKLGNGPGADVTLVGALGTADAGATAESLVFDTSGTVRVSGAIGASDGSNNLDQLTVTQSGGTTFESTLDAESVTLTDTTGTIAFEGDTNIDTGLTAAAGAGGYSISLTGASNRIAGITDFLNTGSVTIGDGLNDVTEFTGGMTTTGGPSGTSVAGAVRTGLAAGQAIDLGDTTLTANTTLDAGAGSVDLLSVTDAGNGFGLTLQNAGATGTVSIGAFTLGSLKTLGGAYDVSLLQDGTVTGDTNFLNTGTVTLGDAAVDVQTFAGGLATAGNATNPATTNVAGTISTSDTRFDLGATTVTDTASLRSGAAALNLASVAASGQILNLQDNGGTGDVAIAGGSTIGTLGTGASAYDLSFNAGNGGSTTTLETATTFDSTGTVAFGNEAADVMIVGGALDSATSTAATTLGGRLTTEAADGQIDLSAATLVADASLESGAGAVNLTSVSDGAGAFDLALQNATSTGTLIATGAVTVDSLTTFDSAYAVNLLGGATVTQDTNFLNTGALVLGDAAGDVFTFDGGLATTGNGSNPGTLNLAGMVATSGDPMDLGAVTLDAATTLATAGGALNAGPVTVGGFDLTLAAGTGSTSIGDATTAVNGAGALTVSSSTNTTFDGSVTAASIALNGTTGVITFTGDAAATNGLTTTTSVNDLVFEEDLSVTGALARFTNSGNLRLGLGNDGDLFTFNAGLDGTGVAGETFLNGEILTGGQDLELSDVTLGQDTVLDSDGGALTFANVTGAGFALTLDGAAGTLVGTSVDDVTTLLLRDAGMATIFGRVSTTTSVDLNGTRNGTYTFGGRVTTPTLTTNAANDGNGVFSLALNGGASITNAVVFDQTGALTLNGVATAQTYTGGVQTSAVGGLVTLSGNLRTEGAALVTGPLTLAGATTLDTTNAGADAAGSTLTTGAVTGGGNALTLNAGTGGTLRVASVAGGGDLTLVNSNDATFSGDVQAVNVALNETATTVTFADGTTNTFGGSLSATGALDLRILGDTTVTVDSTLTNAGGVTFGNETGDTVTFTGGLDTTAVTGGTSLFGTLASGSTQIDLSGTTLGGASVIDTNGGVLNAVDAAGIATAGNALTLDAGVTGVATVSTLTGGGDLRVVDSGSTTFEGIVAAGATTLTDTTGAITFEGDTTLASLTTTSNGYELAFTGADNRVGGTTTLQNTGSLQLGDEATDSIEFTGGVDAAGANRPSSTLLAGTIAVEGGATGVQLDDATLLADLTIDTTNAGVDTTGTTITAGTLSSNGNALTLDAGTGGAVTIDSLTGNGDLTVTNSGSTTFRFFTAASDVTLNDTTGAIAFQGNTNISSGLTTTTNGYGLSFTGSSNTVAGATTLQNTGALVLGNAAGDRTTFTGGLDAAGTAGTDSPLMTNVAGTVATSNADLSLNALTLDSSVGLSTGTGVGNLTTGPVTAGGFDLTLAAGTGSTAIGDTAAAVDDAGTLTVSSSTDTTFDGSVTASTIALNGTTGTITFTGDTTANNGLTTTTSVNNLVFEEDLTVSGALARFTNSGNLRLGLGNDGDLFTFNAGLDGTSVGGETFLNGRILTSGQDLELADVTLEQATTLESNGGALTFANVTGGGFALTLDAASGNLTGTSIDAVTQLVLRDAGTATISGPVSANTSIDLNGAQGGTYRFGGLVTAPVLTTDADDAGVAGDDDFALVLNGGVTIDTAVAFDQTGRLRLNGLGTAQTYDGGLDTTAVGGVVTLTGDILTSGDAMVLGDVSLAAATRLDTGAGADITTGVLDSGGNTLTLDANTTGTIDLGSLVGNGDLILIDSANTTLGDVAADDVDLQQTQGTVSFQGANTTLNGVLMSSGGLALELFSTTTDVQVASDLNHTGGVTFGNGVGDETRFRGGIDTLDTGTTNLSGTLVTNGGRIDLSAVTLDGDASIDTAGGALEAASGIASGGNALSLDGGATGVLTIAELSGDGALTVIDSATTRFTGPVLASDVMLEDTAGLIAFRGNTTISGGLVTATEGYGLAFRGASNRIAGTTTLLNTGALRLGDGAGDSIEFTGGLDAAGASSPSSTLLAGTLTTAGGALALNAATLTTDVSLDTTTAGGVTAGGAITTGTLTGDGYALDLNAGTGGILAVNALTGLSDLVLVDAASAGFAVDSDATTVDLNLATGGTIAFDGVLTTTTLTTNQANDGNNVFSLALNGGASVTDAVRFDQTGFLTLGDDGDTSAFADGVTATAPSSVNINGIVSAAGTGVISLGDADSDVSVAGASRIGGSSTGPVSLGNILLTNGASLTVGTGVATPLALTGVRGTGDGATERLTLDTTAAATVTGAIDSTVDAGGQNNLDELVVTQSGGVRFQGPVDAELVTITDTADGAAVDFAGNLDIGAGLTVQPGTGAYDLSLRGTTTNIAGTTTFRNGGVLDLGDGTGDSLTFATGVVATEPATINLNGSVAVNTGDITLGDGDTQLNVSSATALTSPDGTISVGVASLADDVTLTLGNGGNNVINIAGASGTDDDGATAEALELNTTGDATITGAIGSDANPLDALTVLQSGNSIFQSTVDAGTVTLADTAGTIRFDADLTATTLNTAVEGYAVALPGGVSVTNATSFLNTGGVSLGDQAGDVSLFAGGLDTTAAGTTRLAGTVRTTDSALTLGAVNLDAATTLISGSESLSVAGITGSNQDLTLQDAVSTGTATVTGVLDNLGSLTTAAGAFDLVLQGGGTVTNATTLQNTGSNQLGDEATDAFDFNGGLVATAGTTRLFGSFDTSNSAATLGTTILDGTTSIDTGTGDLTLGATTGNGNDWTLTADGLTLGSLAGGGVVRLEDIVSSRVTNDFAAASLEISGVDAAAFGGNLSSTGALALQELASLDVTGDTSVGSLTSSAVDSTLTFGGTTTVDGALALNDGSAATFSGALAAGSFTAGASGMSISLNGAVDVSGSTNLQNTGGIDLGDDGDVQTFAGGLTATASDISLFAQLRTLGSAVQLGNLTQTGAGSIRTTAGGNGGGAAIMLGTIDGGGFALSLNGGTGGDVRVDSIANAGTTSFVSADAVRIDGGLQATTAVLGDANRFEVGGALDLGALDTSGAGNASVTLTGGGSVEDDTTFANTGGVNLGDGDGDRFVFGGGLDTTAGDTTLNADVATDSGRIDVQALTLAGDSTLDATNDGNPATEGAAVELAGAVTGSNGTESLNLRGGTGAVTATAGVSGIGSFFVRSASDLTLGEVSVNGNSIRGIASGDVALLGNLTDATGDISLITTAGTLRQADDTLILAQQGNVHLAAFNRIRVFDVRSEQGSILLSLLDPSPDPATLRVVERGHASGDFSPDLTARNGVVAVVSGGKSDFGSSDNGFRIDANQQFVSLGNGSSFIDQSNASQLTVLPSAQASQFQQVFEQNTPPRLPELDIEAALLASLSAAITNPANTVASATRATTIESQVLTQQSEEEESLSDLSEDVFIDITLVNAEQQPLCLPESLQGFDSVGCDGQEAVALWLDRLGLQLVAATREDEESVLARMPLPRPAIERFGTAGGGR